MVLADTSGSITWNEVIDQRAFTASLFLKLDIQYWAVWAGIIEFTHDATIHQYLTWNKHNALVGKALVVMVAAAAAVVVVMAVVMVVVAVVVVVVVMLVVVVVAMEEKEEEEEEEEEWAEEEGGEEDII